MSRGGGGGCHPPTQTPSKQLMRIGDGRKKALSTCFHNKRKITSCKMGSLIITFLFNSVKFVLLGIISFLFCSIGTGSCCGKTVWKHRRRTESYQEQRSQTCGCVSANTRSIRHVTRHSESTPRLMTRQCLPLLKVK